MPNEPQPSYRLPNLLIRNRNFALLWAAYGISAFGDHLSEMALLVERNALESERSVRIQALLSFGFFLPFVLLGPVAGWWSDRFSRKWTMIAADLLRAGVVVSLVFAVPALAAWLEPHGLGDYSVVLPLFVVGALAAFFSPSRQAMVPTLIRDDQFIRANALISALGTIATILSAVAGGIIVERWGTSLNYRLDALTFVASGLLLAMIATRRTRAGDHPKLSGVLKPVADGFRYVRTHRRVLQLMVLGTVFWASAGVVNSVIPALVRDVFGGSISDVGVYRGLVGVGLALGAALLGIVGSALPLQLGVLLSLAGGGFWILALDAAYTLQLGRVLSGICLVMIGAHGAGVLVLVLTTIQRFVPDSRRGRVFGVADMVTMGALVVVTGALGLPNIPNLDAYVPWLLAATGLGWLVALRGAWRIYRRGDKLSAAARLALETVRLYARFWCRVRRIGPCTLPREGPVILAANHTAGIDPMVLLATSPRRLISFIVAQEYYHTPVAGYIMRLGEAIPIDRANPGRQFLSSALRHLKDGGCLGIFPQGQFVVPGEEQPAAKSGLGLLALRSGATVVPCHISGTKYCDNPFASLLVRHNVRIKYGRPINLAPFRDRRRDRKAQQEFSELVMKKIEELAPQEGER